MIKLIKNKVDLQFSSILLMSLNSCLVYTLDFSLTLKADLVKLQDKLDDELLSQDKSSKL